MIANIYTKPDITAIVSTKYKANNCESALHAVIENVYNDFMAKIAAISSCPLEESYRFTIGQSYDELIVTPAAQANMVSVNIDDSDFISQIKRLLTSKSDLGQSVIAAIKAENTSVIRAYPSDTPEAKFKAALATLIKLKIHNETFQKIRGEETCRL